MRRRAITLLVLTGCAPVASFRPASSLPEGTSWELGAGGAAVSPRPFVDEPWHGAGQLWFSARAAPWLSLTALAAFDTGAVAGGGAARLELIRVDRFVAGAEAELGWLWGALWAPLAFRLFDETWLYGAPRLGTWGDELGAGGILGASVRLTRGLAVRVEGQASWAAFAYYNRRLHAGLALAYCW